MAKIIKLTAHDGSDFGYMGMKKDKFIGGVDKSEATHFNLKKYPKDKNAHYFEVSSQSGHYLDFKTTNSVLFSDKPLISLSASTIVAWKEINGELHAIIDNSDTTKVVSRSAADPDSKLLYGNSLLSDGKETSCKVEVLEVDEAVA